jgi:hypothetical protein
LCRGFPEIPTTASYLGLASGYQTDVARVTGDNHLASLVDEALRSGPNQPLIVPFATDRFARELRTIAPDAPCVLEAGEAWLRNPHPTFEAWVAALPHDPRHVIGNDERRFARAGFEEAVLPLADHVSAFAELVELHARRYGLDEPAASLASHLSDIARVFGDDAVLFAALRSGKLVAAALGLVHGENVYMRMIGNDHDIVGGTAAHFVVTFYRPLRFCSERGLAGVHLGLSIDRTKRSRGATIEPLWTVVLGAWPAPVSARSLFEARLAAIARDDPGTAIAIQEHLA